MDVSGGRRPDADRYRGAGAAARADWPVFFAVQSGEDRRDPTSPHSRSRRVCQNDPAGRAAAGSKRAIDISHRVGWGDLGLRDLWTAA